MDEMQPSWACHNDMGSLQRPRKGGGTARKTQVSFVARRASRIGTVIDGARLSARHLLL
jgi:hypothetical protein